MSTTPSQLDMALSHARSARHQFECSALPQHAMSHVPVVIVGAGPVGLAAALDLRRHGIACVVLENTAAWVTDRGPFVGQNAR